MRTCSTCRHRKVNSAVRRDSSRQAVKYLRDALKLDPGFAQGWATLAGFLAADYNLFDPQPVEAARAQIYTALDHARKLDPDLPLLNVVTGRVLYEVDHDWPAAETAIQQAIELSREIQRPTGSPRTWRLRMADLMKESSKQTRQSNWILCSHGITSSKAMPPTALAGLRMRRPTIELRSSSPRHLGNSTCCLEPS